MPGEGIFNTMRTLESGHVDDIYKALVELRVKFRPDDAYAHVNHEIIKYLIPFIENPKLSSVSLSIIANACLNSSLRTDVLRNGGVTCLVRVLKSLVNDSIQSIACRALGNIALCPEGLSVVHKHEVVPHIVSLLTSTDDKNCKITAIRTLRILGSSPENYKKIIAHKGVLAIGKLLHSKDTMIIECAVKTVASLTRQCGVDCASQLQDADGLKVLIKLAMNSEKSIAAHALKCLENLSGQAVIRPQLGNAGAIPLFVSTVNSDSRYNDIKFATLALCFCCREPSNRFKMKEANVFPVLLKILGEEMYSEIHEIIILSLLYFRYDEYYLEALLDCDLIKVLTHHLQNYVEKLKLENFPECCDSQLQCEKPKLTLLNSEKSMGCRTDQEEVKSPLKESTELRSSGTEDFVSVSDGLDTKNCSMSKMSLKKIRVENVQDCTFSIHSPSYQEFKTSEKYINDAGSYCDPLYVNCCSPVSASGNCSSPDCISVDFSMHSPPSCSSTEEASDTPVCFSPILGLPSSESYEKPDMYDLEDFSDIEKGTAFANYCSSVNTPNSNVSAAKKLHLEADSDSAFKELPSPLENPRRGKSNVHEKVYQLELSPSSPRCLSLHYKKKPLENSSLVNHIITLLGILTKYFKFTTKIAEKACIEVLVDYLMLLPEPEAKVTEIFVTLLTNCFEKFIHFNFFGIMDAKMKLCSEMIDCTRCSKLKSFQKTLKDNGTAVAKSGYGIGILSHFLLTGSTEFQLNSIYAFSMLVDEKTCLQKLLIDAEGLSILLKFLGSSDPAAFKVAAVSLSRIYSCLNNRPRSVSKKSLCQEKETELSVCQYTSSPCDVSFKLDSEDVVEASRTAVCEKSDFFRALLQGHFSEAHKTVVNLCDVSRAALTTTFHFLHGCSEDTCNFIKNIEFDILLELLCVFDKYFICEFKQSLERQLLNAIEMGTAQKIYFFSKKYNYYTLARQALHFILLAGETEKKELLKATRDLLDQSEVNVLDDIKNYITNMLPGSRDHPLFTRRNSVSS